MRAKDRARGGGQRPATSDTQRGLLDRAERTELTGIADEDRNGRSALLCGPDAPRTPGTPRR
jgi:hypothetical protein